MITYFSIVVVVVIDVIIILHRCIVVIVVVIRSSKFRVGLGLANCYQLCRPIFDDKRLGYRILAVCL